MNPLETMVQRNVVVETDAGRCSGVVIATDTVLTVFHAFDTDSTVRVNGLEAKIVLVRPDIDMAILRVKTDSFPELTFGVDLPIGKQVIQVGNPINAKGVVSFGRVVFVDGKYLYLDTLAIKGFSGGGIYSLNGELVGVAQGMLGVEGAGSWVIRALRSEEIIKALEK